MKKLIYTEDFEKRFATAAKNGSKLCADILKAIKTPDNVRDGVSANYLTTVKINHGGDGSRCIRTVKVTCCTKDFTNENNPEHGSPVGMWRRENRTSVDLQKLAGYFKSINNTDYTSQEYQYAAEILSIDEPLKCVTLKGMENITKLYLYSNYSNNDGRTDTLWNSCMRYEETAEVAGDFYANFCGAKIIGVLGVVTGAVYGRAILWPEIEINGEKGAFLDRVYFTHDALRFMIWDYAEAQGVKFRKYSNDYSSKRYFTKFSDPDNPVEARVVISVPKVKWHKAGSPYTDTFSWVAYENEHFYLNNYGGPNAIAQTDTTGTTASHVREICPICGKVHRGDYGNLCPDCYRVYIKDTPVGKIYTGKTDKQGNPILAKKYVEAAKRAKML